MSAVWAPAPRTADSISSFQLFKADHMTRTRGLPRSSETSRPSHTSCTRSLLHSLHTALTLRCTSDERAFAPFVFSSVAATHDPPQLGAGRRGAPIEGEFRSRRCQFTPDRSRRPARSQARRPRSRSSDFAPSLAAGQRQLRRHLPGSRCAAPPRALLAPRGGVAHVGRYPLRIDALGRRSLWRSPPRAALGANGIRVVGR